MKIYTDEVTIGDLLGIIIRLPKILFDIAKEEWFWRFRLHKYEISTPDWEWERSKSLPESYHRIRRHQKAQKRNLRGVEVR